MWPDNLGRFEHWSFDLWQTLIRPNPAFKKVRSAWILDEFNPPGHSVESIENAFSEMNRLANSINEKVGKNIDALEILASSLYRIDIDIDNLDAAVLNGADCEICRIFCENPPTIFDGQIIPALDFLKKKGCTISLLSNTGSIRGATLKTALAPTGLFDRFDFLLFSDEMGVSKPSPAAFDFLKSEVNSRRPDLPESNILHIGDSQLADELGAKNAGLAAVRINSNNLRLGDLLSQILP